MDINGFLTGLATGDTVKDYSHASRLFVGDNYRLAPKTGWLYHVYLDLAQPLRDKIGGPIGQIEAGMLVKSVDLPKFSIDNKVLNQYNRPNVVQTKIKYDNINIAFHDDHADLVRALWFAYYNYYYRDADLGYSDSTGTPNEGYNVPTKYAPRDNNGWGFTPKGDVKLIKSISIYSMSQKRFAQYTLVNPTIVSFKHGQHQSASTELMQHEMTVAYETVLYGTGWVSKETVRGFADIHYDQNPSPLTPANGTRSILGPGGLLNSADTIVNDLSKGGLKNGVNAALVGFRGLNNLKNMNLGQAAKSELTQIGMDWLRNIRGVSTAGSALNRVFVPNMGNSVSGTPAFNYGRILAVGETKTNSANPSTNNEGNNASIVGGIINQGAGFLNSIGGSLSTAMGGLAGAFNSVTSNNEGVGLATGQERNGVSLSQPSASPINSDGSVATGSGSLNTVLVYDPRTNQVVRQNISSSVIGTTSTAQNIENRLATLINENSAPNTEATSTNMRNSGTPPAPSNIQNT